MSNGRFSLKLGRFYDDDCILQHEEVLDLLNDYADRNEQLVTKCNSLKSRLEDDFNSATCITVQKSKIKDLEKENEQLQQQLTTKHIVNKQYEELQQFKNIVRDYNIPFDKLYSAFEESLNCDCYTDCKNEIERYRKENEELKKENHGIQDKVIRLLDYVAENKCITRNEIKDWWNGND